MGILFFWVCFGIIFSVIIVLFITILRIEVLYHQEQGRNHGKVIFSIFRGCLCYRIDIAKIQFKGADKGIKVEVESDGEEIGTRISRRTIEKMRNNYYEIIHRVSHFQQIVQWFLSKITCEKCTWSTNIGTGDAMETGIVVGMAWGLKSTIIGFLGKSIQWREVPDIRINPSFYRMKLESDFHIIICFRLGNVMRGIYRFVLQSRKVRNAQKWDSTLSKA